MKSIFGVLVLTLFVGVGFPLSVYSETEDAPLNNNPSKDSLYVDEINMVRGELEAIKVYSLTRISITNPDVVDVVEAKEDELLVIAHSIGQTAIFIWDDHGKRTIVAHVFDQSLDIVKNRIEQLLASAQINQVVAEINVKEGKVVLMGDVPDHKKDQFEQIIEPFRSDTINLVQAENIEDLIEIDVQITELNSTLTKNLGIDWNTGTRSSNGSAPSGLSFGYDETLPDYDGSFSDLFKIGDYARTTALLTTINALIEEGNAKILSKPKLVVISGEEASFLVGGEIPIRTTTATSSGSTQENVEFKEFGIGMTITPTIRKNKIDVLLNVEVSDIDASNAVGDDVAFTTRTANTRLFLDDKQTIVLAGLIKHSESETLRKVPFLGDIPIIGILFRNKSTPVADQETELVISLTPTVLTKNRNEPIKPKAVENLAKTETITQMTEETEETEEAEESVQEIEETLGFEESDALKEFEEISSWEVANNGSDMNLPSMKDYIRAVQYQISQSIMYPREAEDYGWEGTVKVALLILNDGTLASATIKESSGYDVFDEYAINTARKVAPYAGFPADVEVQELNVTIPIVYSLRRN